MDIDGKASLVTQLGPCHNQYSDISIVHKVYSFIA